jgi:NAD(P)-dependent dehydrogenase (short-subunit alcohol dehydrogenase family)
MKGKVVVVTGADGGLGSHVTQAFLDAGATVVGTSRKIQQSDFSSATFIAIPAELSSGDAAQKLVNEAISRCGRLDILVHTVGGFAGGYAVADTDDATLQRMLDLNVISLFHMLRATIPVLRKTGTGRIIAVGSRAALEPGAAVGAYSASKAAMVALMKSTALENADANLTVNVILPATMDTPANRSAMPGADFSSWVQPGNVASLAVWLASDAARDVTGAAIPVFGRS